MARENRSWGYDRFVRALANLGHNVSDQTVGNVLRRHGLPPAPERKRTTTWAEFIRTHLALLAATDFFTVEVLTLRGLVTYYVLFFIHLDSRRVPRKSRRVTVGVTYLNMQILALVPAKRMQIDHEPARWVLVCLAAR